MFSLRHADLCSSRISMYRAIARTTNVMRNSINPSSINADQMNTDTWSVSVGLSGSGGQCFRVFSLTTAGKFQFSSEL